jgi:hypothetical protein
MEFLREKNGTLKIIEKLKPKTMNLNKIIKRKMLQFPKSFSS